MTRFYCFREENEIINFILNHIYLHCWMSRILENSTNRENIFLCAPRLMATSSRSLLLSLFRLSGNCGCQINWRELQKGQTTENLGPQTISGFGESFYLLLRAAAQTKTLPEGNPFILNHVRSANEKFSEIIHRDGAESVDSEGM